MEKRLLQGSRIELPISCLQVIEEYRARIRKLARMVSKDANAKREDLESHCAQFRLFLAQSHRFYVQLISRLASAHSLKLDGSMDLHPLLGTTGACRFEPYSFQVLRLHRRSAVHTSRATGASSTLAILHVITATWLARIRGRTGSRRPSTTNR